MISHYKLVKGEPPTSGIMALRGALQLSRLRMMKVREIEKFSRIHEKNSRGSRTFSCFFGCFFSMFLVFLNQSVMDLQQKSRQIELPEFSKSRFARRANMMDEAKSDDATLGGIKVS